MSQLDEQTRTAIADINARLKAARVGVTISARGDRLCIRGTFPPRPGKSTTKPAQTYIRLGIYANPAGLRAAEKTAKKIGVQLSEGEFTWAEWMSATEGNSEQADLRPLIGEWLERFEINYFERRGRSPKTETTWRIDYLQPFQQLPQDAPLSTELLRTCIVSTEAGTRTRQRFCVAMTAMAKFAGLDLDSTGLKGDYSPKKLSPRDLPSDRGISEWRDRISNPHWQWAFGVIACYGLRPHELFHIDFEKFRTSEVLNLIEDEHGGGKTGRRNIWPVYPEWRERWRLWEIDLLPNVTGKDNRELGHRVNQGFGRYGFKKPYNLRHAWAVRTIEFGLPVELAAQQMGHSLAVHTNIYHHWISDEVHQRAYEIAMRRTDRPIAP